MNNCPICDHHLWNEKYKINEWSIYECTECLFSRIEPFPTLNNRKEYYSEEKVVGRNISKQQLIKRLLGYPKYLIKKISPRDKNIIFSKKILKNVSRGSSVLDIGCGDGSFLELIKNDFGCSGMEISEYLSSLAQKRKNIKVATGNFLDEVPHPFTYDAVTLISLIEHLSDPALALRKCFDFLNPNGILLLKTVNYRCWNRRIMGKKWNGFRPPDHMIYFSPENLKKLLQKIGFKNICISSFPFNDNMYAEARKII